MVINISPSKFDKLYNKASDLERKGKLDKALQLFDEAIQLNSSSPYGWEGKGVILEKLNRIEEAKECYRNAYKINPKIHFRSMKLLNSIKSEKPLLSLKQIKNQKEESADKEEKSGTTVMLKVVENPHIEKSEAFLKKGEVFLKQGRYGDALTKFIAAADENPDSVPAWVGKGIGAIGVKNYDFGIACLKRALSMDPNNITALLNIGSGYILIDKNTESLEYTNKALELAPNESGAWYNKGLALYNLKQNEEALECMNKALEINSGMYRALLRKGEVLERLGQNIEAIEVFNRVLSIRPNEKRALDGVQRIKTKS